MRDVIIDHEGQLAIDCGWSTDWNNPVEHRTLYIGRAKASDWPDLIGCPVSWTGNTGSVYRNGRTYYLHSDDTQEWTRLVETRPVKKPRRGRDYDWFWQNGQWVKTWR